MSGVTWLARCPACHWEAPVGYRHPVCMACHSPLPMTLTPQTERDLDDAVPTAWTTVNPEAIDSVVLRRLIEEVRSDHANGPALYDRTYNRHNRS